MSLKWKLLCERSVHTAFVAGFGFVVLSKGIRQPWIVFRVRTAQLN